MQESYKIYFPYSKEELLDRIRQTAKPLTFSNQAYRNIALAAYREEDDTLCIGYAAGIMTGGGWEMLQTHMKSQGNNVMLEGKFVLLPYIKKGVRLYLLYRNISKIGKSEERRRLILSYLEYVLHAKIEVSEEEL